MTYPSYFRKHNMRRLTNPSPLWRSGCSAFFSDPVGKWVVYDLLHQRLTIRPGETESDVKVRYGLDRDIQVFFYDI